MKSEGQGILKTIHTHNKAYGGHFIEITAGTGKGKTAMLLSTALYNLSKYPNEKTFFSECFNTPIQTLKLGKDKVMFLIAEKDKDKIVFRDRDNNLSKVPLEKLNVKFFRDFIDLYDIASFDKVNVPIFLERRDIMDFVKFTTGVGEFTTVLIDEMSEIATALDSGLWHRAQEWAFMCKDLRKCMVNVWYTAQNVGQVDWRIRSAVDIKIFGPAAREDRHSRIMQRAIDNLYVDKEHGSEFYISDGGTFGLFRLTDIFEPKEGLNFEFHKK